MHSMHPDAVDPSPVILLTTQDVQRLMKVDRSTIYRMAEDGRLPAVKVGRQWRFPEDRLHEWLRRSAPAAADPQARGLGATLGRQLLQAVADLLGEALEAMIVLTDLTGRPLADPSNTCGLFDAVHDYPGVLDKCVGGWQALAAEADLEPQWRATPLGFLCARSLVRDGERLVGMIVAGGIAPQDWPPSPEECERLASGLGVPSRVVQERAAEVHHLDAVQQERVLRLLPRSAAFVSRLAMEGSRLAGRLEAIASLALGPTQRSNA